MIADFKLYEQSCRSSVVGVKMKALMQIFILYCLSVVVFKVSPTLAIQQSMPEKTQAVFTMTAELAHQLIEQQQPSLLGDGSQLISLYYFGQSHSMSIVGLEKVGDDYLPIRWLLVFKKEDLLGWYYPVSDFPSAFKSGYLSFPKGAQTEDVLFWPKPPADILLDNKHIPFISNHASLHFRSAKHK